MNHLILASYLDFHWIQSPDAWGAFVTLTLLEIVLGIDNVIFISILVDRLPQENRKFARNMGLGLAMVARLVLLASISWIMTLKDDVFSIPMHPLLIESLEGNVGSHSLVDAQGMMGISVKDLILIFGGLFLIWKSTKEIHHKLEAASETSNTAKVVQASLAAIFVQIIMVDIVFSLDSVITAVGMVNDPTRVSLMMCAVIVSVAVMLAAAGAISSFVSKHPSVKVLALAFLILIGTTLFAEGLGLHVPKGYIYFAMTFSFVVELVNLRLRKSPTLPAH
jgi:predicted tellurium resistance membrane protein TerC